LEANSQRYAELSLRLTGCASGFLSLLLIELILPRLIHQVGERTEVDATGLNGALSAGAAL